MLSAVKKPATAPARTGQPEWVQHAQTEATGVALQPISVIDL